APHLSGTCDTTRTVDCGSPRSTAPPSKPPPHPLPGQPPSASVPPINIDISWSCSSSLRETARIFLSHFWGPVQRACQPRDGPGTSDPDSTTRPPAGSPGPATVLALPARALPRPARPTAMALHASLNDRHRGAEISGTDVARDPLASLRAGNSLSCPGGGTSPGSSPQGEACAKTQPSARRRQGTCITSRYGDWYFDKSRKRLAKAPEIPDAPVGRYRRPAAAAALDFFPKWCAKTPARRRAQLSNFWAEWCPEIPTPAASRPGAGSSHPGTGTPQ